MSDVILKKASRTVPGTSRGNTYKGWKLVETGHNYYHACKGSRRVAVGSQRHGDINDLVERFHRKVDEMEGRERMTDVDTLAKENERLSKEVGVLQKAYAIECENGSNLEAENAKLRELSVRMARALGVKSGWCTTDCAREFGCAGIDMCPIEVALKELGLDVYKRAKSKG